MSTVYDAVTIGLFAGLAILFLQRSAAAEPRDKIYHYVPPAVGCAAGNWLGNQHQDIWAIVVIAASVVYSLFVLKPFNQAQ